LILSHIVMQGKENTLGNIESWAHRCGGRRPRTG